MKRRSFIGSALASIFTALMPRKLHASGGIVQKPKTDIPPNSAANPFPISAPAVWACPNQTIDFYTCLPMYAALKQGDVIEIAPDTFAMVETVTRRFSIHIRARVLPKAVQK